ncbi:hypothetical protein ACETU7_25715 [Rhodococcus sp. 3Y1]
MRSIRWIVCSLLIVLAGLGAAGSVLALFVHTQVNDTDSYVETVAPLASEPAVQAAVVDRLTEELTQRLDRFPQVVTRQAEKLVREAAQSLVSSDQFATLWTAANRQAHAQLAAMVTGRATDGIVRSDDSGTVTLSLEPIMTELRTNLRDRGFTVVDRLPTFDPQFEILQSDELVRAQDLSNTRPGSGLAAVGVAGLCDRGRRSCAEENARTVPGRAGDGGGDDRPVGGAGRRAAGLFTEFRHTVI